MRFFTTVLIGVAATVSALGAQQPGTATVAPPAAVIKSVAEGVHIFDTAGINRCSLSIPPGFW